MGQGARELTDKASPGSHLAGMICKRLALVDRAECVPGSFAAERGRNMVKRAGGACAGLELPGL